MGGADSDPHDFFDRSAQKTVQSGGHGVCKSKLLHWEDTQNGFGPKKILWPGPEALKVRPAENSGVSKYGFFYFGLRFGP